MTQPACPRDGEFWRNNFFTFDAATVLQGRRRKMLEACL